MSLPKLVTLSDTHTGSKVGLLRPGFTTLDGEEVHLNPFQKWLWESNEAALKWARQICGKAPVWLVLNGDAIEGIHHGGHGCWSMSETEHMRAFRYTFAPWLKIASRVVMVEGTECHTKAWETLIGELDNMERDPSTRRHVFERLAMNVNGVEMVWRHHISATVRPYLEGSALSIALGCERQEAQRAGHPVPQVVTCAHRHRHGMFDDGTGICAVTGPWQGLTRHGRKVVTAAVPMPSVLIYDFDGKAKGELPDVRRKVIPAPAARRVT
jgi:hypothetical protein